jgi:FkbM family methyltransferase
MTTTDPPRSDLGLGSFPSLLARLALRVTPRTIIDVGASDGRWSEMALASWPCARYHLLEANPVFRPSLEEACLRRPEHSFTMALVGGEKSRVPCRFNLENPYQGVDVSEGPGSVLIDSTPVDAEVREHDLPPPYLLKFDVHGHETAILEGCPSTLPETCAIVMEVYTWRQGERSLRFWDMCSHLEKSGFLPTDMCEPLYRPYDGRLCQVDMLFERADAEGMNTSRYR